MNTQDQASPASPTLRGVLKERLMKEIERREAARRKLRKFEIGKVVDAVLAGCPEDLRRIAA
jgi:hypothetical protein